MLMTRNLRRCMALGLLTLLVLPVLAHAGSPLGIGTAEPSFATSGPFGTFLGFINQYQQAFYRALTNALKAMRTDPLALSSLIGLSFAYGVFHAAGPGHGKAVISSYMIANETELKRGVMISFASSFLQGGVALLLVSAAFLVLRGTSVSLTNATDMFERLSYGSIILFGLYLLYRKMRSMAVRAEPAMGLAGNASVLHGHPHSHHLHHGHVHGNHAHHDHADGMVCATCGHSHAPSPADLKGDTFRLRDAWSAIVSVGLRPCSGALLVLTFSLLNGLYLGGFLSVLAMSFGTALTVSLLATLAVTAKHAAMRYAGTGQSAVWLGNSIEIFGAVLVIALGATLLMASLAV